MLVIKYENLNITYKNSKKLYVKIGLVHLS